MSDRPRLDPFDRFWNVVYVVTAALLVALVLYQLAGLVCWALS